jgi:hypothetical protein
MFLVTMKGATRSKVAAVQVDTVNFCLTRDNRLRTPGERQQVTSPCRETTGFLSQVVAVLWHVEQHSARSGDPPAARAKVCHAPFTKECQF